MTSARVYITHDERKRGIAQPATNLHCCQTQNGISIGVERPPTGKTEYSFIQNQSLPLYSLVVSGCEWQIGIEQTNESNQLIRKENIGRLQLFTFGFV